jgi:acyl dehydratase
MRFEDVVPGAEPPPLVVGPVTRTDIVRYQGASGDFNPVHHDEPFALGSGYPAPLGVGMFTAGCMNSWASDWLGPDRVRRTRIRWKKPMFPGFMLHCHGKIVGRDEALHTVDLELWVADAAGDVLVQGWMTFDLSDAP